jgi:hypothetical protein
LTIKFTLHTSRYSGRLPPYSPSPLSPSPAFAGSGSNRSSSYAPGSRHKFVLYYARQYSVFKDLGSPLHKAQKSSPGRVSTLPEIASILCFAY